MPSRPAALVAASLAALVPLAVPAGAGALVGEAPSGWQRIALVRHHGFGAVARDSLLRSVGARPVERLTIPGAEVIAVPPRSAAASLAALRGDPRVEWAAFDTVVRPAGSVPQPRFRVSVNDPLIGSQWSFANTGQAVDGVSGKQGADARVRLAWNIASGLDPATSAGVVVAVVDGGVDTTHPDLVGRIASNPGEIPGNSIDDDHNGFVDDVAGWDFVDGDATPSVATEAHGTHVAGIIAARRNDRLDIAGAAPLAKVLPLRVISSAGTGHLSDVAQAFDYAGSLGVPVVNASIAGDASDSDARLIRAAAQRHPDTLYVVAAGNAASNLDSSPTTPCVEAVDNIVCVGASDQNDGRLATSNWSSTLVDLFAPGARIVSLAAGGGTSIKSGTSMAAPLVAATAALVISAGGAQRGAGLRKLLIGTSDPVAALSGLAVGGRLNTLNAVLAVRPDGDSDGVADAVDVCPAQYASSSDGCPVDTDSDGVSDDFDNCPNRANANQADDDGDGTGNVCDYTPRGDDPDLDRVGAMDDNCPTKMNVLQTDSDHDGVGNVCDPTPFGPDDDKDGLGSAEDNCPDVANAGQGDADNDRVGDACDPTPRGDDSDADGVGSVDDRCPGVAGPTANAGCPWAPPRVKRLSFKRKGSALRMSVSMDVAGSLKVTMSRNVCRRGRCRWVPQPALTKALRAGQIIGIDLGRVGAGKYRVTLAPTARGVLGRTVVKVVKVG